MIQRKDVMKSLPLLAGILGRQYNVRVEIGGTGAFTDGNTIHLPALPEDMGDTLLKVTKGFLDHEAAHIRETDFAKLKAAKLTPFQLHLMNIIEDWRVEERISDSLSGTCLNLFLKTHIHLRSRPFRNTCFWPSGHGRFRKSRCTRTKPQRKLMPTSRGFGNNSTPVWKTFVRNAGQPVIPSGLL